MTLDDFDRIVVETQDGELIAVIDFSIEDEPIKVADGYQVRMRPKND